MSNENRNRALAQQSRENTKQRAGSDHAICLHCGNMFRVTEGVVTPEAAICDVCNDGD
jgi:hypothetical protein